MNPSELADQIEYPESDGLPMGETDTHRKWMMRILDLLSYRYRDERVYVASNLLVYYEPGQVMRNVVPAAFVVRDCDPHDRRTFKTWEEQCVPDVVFEVTSRSTSRDDLVNKPKVYERIGVQEYFLYDPLGEYLDPPLRGFRLRDGEMIEIEPRDGQLPCATLGLDLKLDAGALMLYETASGKILLSEAEAERSARERLQQRNRELEAELKRLRNEQR